MSAPAVTEHAFAAPSFPSTAAIPAAASPSSPSYPLNFNLRVITHALVHDAQTNKPVALYQVAVYPPTAPSFAPMHAHSLRWKRYSEFLGLHEAITGAAGTMKAALPTKWNLKAMIKPDDPGVMFARQEALSTYAFSIASLFHKSPAGSFLHTLISDWLWTDTVAGRYTESSITPLLPPTLYHLSPDSTFPAGDKLMVDHNNKKQLVIYQNEAIAAARLAAMTPQQLQAQHDASTWLRRLQSIKGWGFMNAAGFCEWWSFPAPGVSAVIERRLRSLQPNPHAAAGSGTISGIQYVVQTVHVDFDKNTAVYTFAMNKQTQDTTVYEIRVHLPPPLTAPEAEAEAESAARNLLVSGSAASASVSAAASPPRTITIDYIGVRGHAFHCGSHIVTAVGGGSDGVPANPPGAPIPARQFIESFPPPPIAHISVGTIRR